MNDAAERLRAYLSNNIDNPHHRAVAVLDVDAAIAAERRATVERIRAALREEYGAMPEWPYLDRILDAEAER